MLVHSFKCCVSMPTLFIPFLTDEHLELFNFCHYRWCYSERPCKHPFIHVWDLVRCITRNGIARMYTASVFLGIAKLFSPMTESVYIPNILFLLAWQLDTETKYLGGHCLSLRQCSELFECVKYVGVVNCHLTWIVKDVSRLARLQGLEWRWVECVPSQEVEQLGWRPGISGKKKNQGTKGANLFIEFDSQGWYWTTQGDLT